MWVLARGRGRGRGERAAPRRRPESEAGEAVLKKAVSGEATKRQWAQGGFTALWMGERGWAGWGEGVYKSGRRCGGRAWARRGRWRAYLRWEWGQCGSKE